jgi:hypothetical protein
VVTINVVLHNDAKMDPDIMFGNVFTLALRYSRFVVHNISKLFFTSKNRICEAKLETELIKTDLDSLN